ncbi:MAG: hypothetical protein KatS3mg117_0664 [Geminicoccaceae bacterium]|nr:MAG: hypothetical protein KatS3mg117_0664 [Geminicoccaceae bacterium]
MPQPSRRALVLAVVAGAAVGRPARAQRRPELQRTLEIVTRIGTVSFTIELAITPDELARGLMFRASLPERHGMLFDFGREQEVAFWMRNTLIPLDMLFIGADGVVRHLHENATPLSEEAIPSRYPVRAVLEIAGGSARRLGIAVGDRVRHPIFGPG